MSNIDKETARSYLLEMSKIRHFEEACGRMYMQGKIKGFLHLYIGEEAIAVGAISGAYSTEVIRGAFLAIPRGQIDAAKSVGMNKFIIFTRILIPQILRYALPGLGNVWQLTLKDTALIMVTGLVEIMRQSHIASGSTYSPFTFYLTAALLYLILTTVSNTIFNSAENWANKGVRRA